MRFGYTLEADSFPGRERVVSPEHEVEGVVEEVDVVEPVVRAENSPIVVHADRPTVKLEHDRKVELPCPQPGEVLVRLAVGEVDLDAGVQRVEPFHCASSEG